MYSDSLLLDTLGLVGNHDRKSSFSGVNLSIPDEK
jgi:hypothetical protein